MANGEQRKWYQSPWMWVTGGCCLGCLIIPLACVAIVGTGGILAVTKSPVMQEAMDRAQASTALAEELGAPIEHHWLGGSTSLNIEGARTRIEISIQGPKSSAQLSGEGQRRGGVWSFEWLEARLEDGRVIDLLSDEVKPDDRQFEQIPFDEPEPPAEDGPPAEQGGVDS